MSDKWIEPPVYAIVRCEGPSNPEAWIKYDGWWYSYSHPRSLLWEELIKRGPLTLLHNGLGERRERVGDIEQPLTVCGPECNGTWPAAPGESPRAYHVKDCPNNPDLRSLKSAMSESPKDWEHVDARHEWSNEHGSGAESNLRRCPICHAVVPRFHQTEHLIWHDLNDSPERK